MDLLVNMLDPEGKEKGATGSAAPLLNKQQPGSSQVSLLAETFYSTQTHERTHTYTHHTHTGGGWGGGEREARCVLLCLSLSLSHTHKHTHTLLNDTRTLAGGRARERRGGAA